MPGMQFGVQLIVTAPFVSVIAKGFESLQDGPDDGAAKSTRTLGAGLPVESRTVARMVEPLAATAIVAPGGARTAP